jgi:hypothetical protein
MKKIIRLTERDLTRLVRRVIKENEDDGEKFKNEDIDSHLRNIIRGFDTENSKDFTEIISDFLYLIDNSESVDDFKMKYKKFAYRNKKDLDRLTDDEKNQLDGFINSVMTRHDFFN